jgi:polar amino acid transport system ATP-binding protein
VTELLRVSGLRKSYGDKVVLRGIDLAVNAHDVVCLIGASGSGKSTLLRCLNLLETIDDGVVEFEGEDITDPRVDVRAVRRRMGMVFQAYNLFPHMTVLDNVTLAPRHVHRMSRAQAEQQGRALLTRFGLADKADSHPDRLSGGQQQRAAMARALATNPSLVLLDEVTSALDPELVGEVLDIMRDMAESGTTMVVATHEMSFARDVASTVCFLHDGVILEQGPPSQVLADPSHDRTRQFLRRVLTSCPCCQAGDRSGPVLRLTSLVIYTPAGYTERMVHDTHTIHAGAGWRPAVSATLHCLTGCAIGEVLGMVLATWWGWGNWPSVVLSVVLAFFFGYALTVSSVLRASVPLRRAVRVALAADTLSIAVMEVVDNAVLVLVPGALAAGLADLLFWGSLVFSLAVAFVITVPVNRWMIERGRGHAVVHDYH